MSQFQPKTPHLLQSRGGNSAGLPSFWPFAVLLICLVLCFWRPLLDLAGYSLRSEDSELYSHVLLVPAISLYFVWIRRHELRPVASGEARSLIWIIPAIVGVSSLIGYLVVRQGLRTNDYLALTIFAFVCFVTAAGWWTLDRKVARRCMFPFGFLLFMVPFPTFIEKGIEIFFQHSSADAAHVLFSILQTPVFREGVVFHLPGTIIKVAEECSGIRSSLVLFITSVLAGELFLSKPWKRAVLAFLVIPLGIVRNGFRIVTIGMLCIHVGPEMIDSPIHRRGGPLFFLLSLIPFFLVLLWLRKSEKRVPDPTPTPNLNPNPQGPAPTPGSAEANARLSIKA